ncbi:hypothetical protein LguiA_021855 [Lonicera macranthoides]
MAITRCNICKNEMDSLSRGAFKVSHSLNCDRSLALLQSARSSNGGPWYEKFYPFLGTELELRALCAIESIIHSLFKFVAVRTFLVRILNSEVVGTLLRKGDRHDLEHCSTSYPF